MSNKRSALAWLLVGGIGLSACTGDDGVQGPPGADGHDGEDATSSPSLSAVIPKQAFLARTLDVTIAGFGTSWDDTTTVDFGAGVTVNSVTVASPTALVVSITVDSDAAVGLRDVTVTGGADEPLVYSQAFSVLSPIESVVVDGTAAQGSIMFVTFESQDVATPFDTTMTGDGFFTPIEYPNISVVGPSGLGLETQSVSLFSVQALALVDVDTAAEAHDLSVLSGTIDNLDQFPAPGALEIAARTATPITLGTDADGSIDDEYASSLYRLETGSSPQLVDLAIAASSGAPAFALLPESGRFDEMISFSSAARILSTSESVYYLVTWDNTGAKSYDFVISSEPTALAGTAAESEPNNAPGTAQTAAPTTSAAFALVDASLSSVTDQDWLELTVDAGAVGSVIHVVTMPGDSYCDTVVEVFEGDGTTSLGGPSANSNYHESHSSAAIPAAGTYYVKISADQTGWFDSSYPNYQAVVSIE